MHKNSKKTSALLPQRVTYLRALPCSLCLVWEVLTGSWPTPLSAAHSWLLQPLSLSARVKPRAHSPPTYFEQGIFFHSLYVPAQPWNPKCIWAPSDSNNPFYSLNLLNSRFNTPCLSHAIELTDTIAAFSSDESFFTGRKEENQFQSLNRELICPDFNKHY